MNSRKSFDPSTGRLKTSSHRPTLEKLSTAEKPMRERTESTGAVLECGSFDEVLSSLIREKQAQKSTLSLGFFAKRFGLSSSATLTNYLKGRRVPGRDFIQTISSHFGLTRLEEEYTASLADRDRLLTVNDSSALRQVEERIKTLKRIGKITKFRQGAFEAFCSPMHFTIRELYRTKNPPQSADDVRARMNFERTNTEIESAIAELIQVGLLTKDASGKIIPSDSSFDTDSDVVNESLKIFHEQSLDFARKTVRTHLAKDRHFVSEVFAMKKENLPQAKELIEKFRKEFSSLLEAQVGEADEVFQLNVNFVMTAETRVHADKKEDQS